LSDFPDEEPLFEGELLSPDEEPEDPSEDGVFSFDEPEASLDDPEASDDPDPSDPVVDLESLDSLAEVDSLAAERLSFL
jgi:hypothetical protein